MRIKDKELKLVVFKGTNSQQRYAFSKAAISEIGVYLDAEIKGNFIIRNEEGFKKSIKILTYKNIELAAPDPLHFKDAFKLRKEKVTCP